MRVELGIVFVVEYVVLVVAVVVAIVGLAPERLFVIIIINFHISFGSLSNKRPAGNLSPQMPNYCGAHQPTPLL